MVSASMTYMVDESSEALHEPPKMMSRPPVPVPVRRVVVLCAEEEEEEEEVVVVSSAEEVGRREEASEGVRDSIECPTSGGRPQPVTTGCVHVHVGRWSTTISRRMSFPLYPPVINRRLPTRVAACPDRFSGGVPVIMGAYQRVLAPEPEEEGGASAALPGPAPCMGPAPVLPLPAL